MTALEMPRSLSIEDYLAGEQVSEIKHEYLGGTVHAMSGGSGNHSAIAANFLVSIGGALRGKPCRPFTSDLKIRIDLADHTRFYYPDAQVVCRPGEGSRLYEDHPVVVLEVISPSTRRTDLGEKRDTYLSIASLKVLILAESEERYVIVHRRKKDGGFAIEEYSAAGGVIDLPEIEVALPLADLYSDIAFDRPA